MKKKLNLGPIFNLNHRLLGHIRNRREMLLDLDHGSMTIYKNNVLLGVMVESGLTGRYRWAVSTCRNRPIKIESAPPPPTPTAEELEAAIAREVQSDAFDF